MLQLRCEDGALALRGAGLEITGWRPAIEIDGRQLDATLLQVTGSGAQRRVTASFGRSGVSLELCCSLNAAADGGLRGSLRLDNHSRRAVAVGRVFPLRAASVTLAGPPEALLLLPQPGVISQRGVYRATDAECPSRSWVKLLLYNPEGRAAALIGFDTFTRCDTVIERLAAGGLAAWCDFGGWQLAAGSATAAEVFTITAGPDPYALLEAWADRAALACVPRPRRWEDAPLGWLGWAWVDSFNVENYEEVVVRNCRAIRERLPGHEIRYVWVSIGNLGEGPGDWLTWNYRTFPSGPQGFVARLQELGFRLGLWCGPFFICSALREQVEELDREGALLYHDGQRLVVYSVWHYGRYGALPAAERPCMYALDPTHPRSLAHVRHAFATYRSWGIRYYMVDFLNAGCGSVGPYPYDAERLHDRGLVPGPEAYRHFLAAVRDACGDDTYLLSSTGPTLHNAGMVDAVRTGSDFGEGRPLTLDSFFYPASYVVNSGGFWTGPLYALRNQATSYYTHRRLFLNDSGNVLTLDSPLPVEDARLHATIHTFGGSPSMFGDDIARLAPDRLEMLRQTLPRPKEVAFPVDLFSTAYPDHPKVFRRLVAAPWGSFAVVAVYNFGPDLLAQRLDWEQLGLPRQPHLVWEFWNQEYVGTGAAGIEVAVPPRAARVFRLTPASGRPCLLGTDMHLTMGEMEVLDLQWDEATQTLSGRAWRPAGERGHVFLHAPTGLAVRQPKGFWIAKDGRDETLIIKVALDFGAGAAGWSIGFDPVS